MRQSSWECDPYQALAPRVRLGRGARGCGRNTQWPVPGPHKALPANAIAHAPVRWVCLRWAHIFLCQLIVLMGLCVSDWDVSFPRVIPRRQRPPTLGDRLACCCRAGTSAPAPRPRRRPRPVCTSPPHSVDWACANRLMLLNDHRCRPCPAGMGDKVVNNFPGIPRTPSGSC